jgi:hypothetical protein
MGVWKRSSEASIPSSPSGPTAHAQVMTVTIDHATERPTGMKQILVVRTVSGRPGDPLLVGD